MNLLAYVARAAAIGAWIPQPFVVVAVGWWNDRFGLATASTVTLIAIFLTHLDSLKRSA